MFLANLVVSTGMLLDPFDVSFGVYNVFDEQYSIPGAGGNTHLQDTIRQDGRTFRLQVSCEF
jgi:outer membrane receptor protein involved in Fe transport